MSSAAALPPTTVGEVFTRLAALIAEMLARMVGVLLEVRAELPRWHPMRMVISAEVSGLRALSRRIVAFVDAEVAAMEAEDAEAARVRAEVARPRLVWVRRDEGAARDVGRGSRFAHPRYGWGERGERFPRPLYPPKWGVRTGFAASLTALEAA